MQSHWNIFCRMTVRVEQGKSMEEPQEMLVVQVMMMDTHVEILAVVMERRRNLQEIQGLETVTLVFKLCSASVAVLVWVCP